MWCFVDGGALAETVPRRLITSGAVVWVDVPPDVPLEEIHLTDELIRASQPSIQEVVRRIATEMDREAEALVAEAELAPVVVEAPAPPKRRPPRRKK